ncbi:hypothetical protein [Bacillus pseudomycoides]|uniref:hypothetical protein n=1 Tax=Bacillus pseudomycoides TaxID=64104 RepID=UPI000BF68510|nr:hypothetical protein [Bacillus pseudomycoides]PEP73816.1 hypothetical protein CN584_28145 [Bacillus pseudomycoides]
MDAKTFDKLQTLRRYKEPIPAVLRTVKRTDKDNPDTEYAEFALESGKIIGICKKEDFSDHAFKGITQLTGHIFPVIITQMSDEIDVNKVQVSVKEVNRRAADSFIRELIELEENDKLQEPTYIVGIARSKLSTLEPKLAQLRKTLDYKLTLNRVVGVAFNNISEMHSAIDKAINDLTYMSAQWHDLDSKYSGVMGCIDNTAQKADQNKFKFLKPNLDAAKDSWKTVRTDAFILKEGIKELKMQPVTPQK